MNEPGVEGQQIVLQVDYLDVGLWEWARDHAVEVEVLLAGHFLIIVVLGHAM